MFCEFCPAVGQCDECRAEDLADQLADRLARAVVRSGLLTSPAQSVVRPLRPVVNMAPLVDALQHLKDQFKNA